MQTINHRSGPRYDGCRRQAAKFASQSYIVRSPLAFCDSSVFICAICGQHCDSIKPSRTCNNQKQPTRSYCDARNAIQRAGIYDMLTTTLTRLPRMSFHFKNPSSATRVQRFVRPDGYGGAQTNLSSFSSTAIHPSDAAILEASESYQSASSS